MKAFLLPILALLVPARAGAETPGLAPTDFASNLGQMLFGLVVVIALLIACLWLIKRLSAPRSGAASIKVMGATAVGPRERVVLVEVGPKVLVLGVAPGSVNTLHVMDGSDFPPPAAAVDSATGGPNDFSNWLKKSLERRHDAS